LKNVGRKMKKPKKIESKEELNAAFQKAHDQFFEYVNAVAGEELFVAQPINLTMDNSFTMVDRDGNPMHDDRPITAYKEFFMEDYPFFDENTIFYDSENRYRLVKIEKDEESK
jgi:hypothetical protein